MIGKLLVRCVMRNGTRPKVKEEWVNPNDVKKVVGTLRFDHDCLFVEVRRGSTWVEDQCLYAWER